MSITISRIIQALEPSATLTMAAKAKELKAQGKTVFDFSVGEPDFTTPRHICDAAPGFAMTNIMTWPSCMNRRQIC